MPEIFDATSETDMKPNHTHSHGHRHVDEYSEIMRAERPTGNPLRAFLPKPISVVFESQIEEEHILLVLRQHPFTLVKKVLMVIGLFLAPVLFNMVGFFSFAPLNFQIAGLMLWYLLISGFALEVFLVWFFSVYIITDERIIDVDFLSLIYKDISTAKIDKIEDITVITGGAIQSLFNFGTVNIQTAGANTEIEFENVPQPAKVSRLLNELIMEEEREKIEGRVN